jgi:histidine ammonia-lyase
VPTRLAALASRGVIAYALRQKDGSAIIYAGAYETSSQAAALAVSLRAAGVAPVLVYRTGRAF